MWYTHCIIPYHTMIVTYYSSIHHQGKINLFTVSSSSITIIIFCLQSYVMKDFTTFSRCYMCQSVHMTIIISLFHQLLHRILVVFLNYCSPTVQHMGPLTATGFKSKVIKVDMEQWFSILWICCAVCCWTRRRIRSLLHHNDHSPQQ